MTCGFVTGSLLVETAPFIIWDFDKNPKRVEMMPVAYANLESGGIVYVDDMHNVEIRAAFERLDGEYLADTEVDAFGRYGTFVRKLRTGET